MLRSLALLLFVLATLPMAFFEPFVGLLLWVLFSYMNPYRDTYGFAYNMHWVFMIASVTLFSMMLNSKKVRSIRWTPLSVSLLMFLVSTGISAFFAVMNVHAHAAWIQFMKVQVMVFVTLMLVYDKKRLHWMLWVIVLSFGFWSVKGGLFSLATGGHYHVLGPTQSFYRDNNQFALVMCMALPVMRYLQTSVSSFWVRRFLWVLLGLTVMSILGTYSRGGLITLVMVLLFLILKSRKRVSILATALIAVPLVVGFLPQHWKARMTGITTGHAEHSASFQGRIQSWEFATNVAIHRPLTGGGFGVWASNQMWDEYGPPGAYHRAIHSIWFQVLGENGFLGFILFVMILSFSWRNLSYVRKTTKSVPDRLWMHDLAGYLQISLVAYVVGGSALPQAYFDFTYQICALTQVLRYLTELSDSELKGNAFSFAKKRLSVSRPEA